MFCRWKKIRPKALVSELVHRNPDHKRWNVPYWSRRPARSLVPFWHGDPRGNRDEGMDLWMSLILGSSSSDEIWFFGTLVLRDMQ